MENEYKFVSKFVEGKTYNELTDEEIEKIKTGTGVKKEDKEYLASLEKHVNVSNEPCENELAPKTEETIQENKTEEISEKTKNNNNSARNINKPIEKIAKGIKVIKAMGNELVLENGATVKLSKEELKAKAFWHKGDVYYGKEK